MDKDFVERLRVANAEVARLNERVATLETERNHAKGKLDAAQPVLEGIRLWLAAPIASKASMGALIAMTEAAKAYQAEQTKATTS